jgi:hypothetical protein
MKIVTENTAAAKIMDLGEKHVIKSLMGMR